MTKLHRLLLGASLCIALLVPATQAAAATTHSFTATATGEPNLYNRPEFSFPSGLNNSCEQISFSGVVTVPGPVSGTVKSTTFSKCFITPSYPAITITSTNEWNIAAGPNLQNAHFHVNYGILQCQFDMTGTLYGKTSGETATGATWTFLREGSNAESLTISNVVGGCGQFQIQNGGHATFIAPKGMQVQYLN